MHLAFFPFLVLALKMFLFSAQIFVDLGTDERTEMKKKIKKILVCDLTLWLMLIEMIKLNEVIFILLFSLFFHSLSHF